MEDYQEKLKDSPFYVEYKGNKNPSIPCHASQSFIDALSKHLKGKYPKLVNKQGNHNLGASVRLILENYLNAQCISRKSYDYNIVAIIADTALGSGLITVCDVIKDELNKESILTGHSRKLYWAKVNNDALNERYAYEDLSNIGNRIDKIRKDESDAFLVVDLPLNNFFDEYVDGIYTADAENKALHCGVNLITTTDKVYCVVYDWYVNFDFKPVISSICFEDLDSTMKELSKVNVNAFMNFEKSLKVIEDKMPKDDLESLKKKNEILERDIEKFKDSIAFLQEKIDANNLKIKEHEK